MSARYDASPGDKAVSIDFARLLRKLKRYEAQVLRQCDVVAAVAEEDRAILHQLAPAATIGVVPNGVDTEYFSSSRA